MTTLKIGTRASNLALAQSYLVKKALEKLGHTCEIIKLSTKGDADQRDFKKILGDGFFTRTIENALLEKQIDIAVHSAKDLPSLKNHYLPWLAFGSREQENDILISKKGLKNIKHIGTSSPRREMQITKDYPEAKISPIRGNVESRLKKISDGQYDATILAKAGLIRLNLLNKIAEEFDIQELEYTSAPNQGIIAVQTRLEDYAILKEVANEELSQIALKEKEVLRYLGGGCHLAVAANANKGNFHFFRNNKEYSFNNRRKNFLSALSESMSDNTYEKKVLLTHSAIHHEKALKEFAKEKIGAASYPLIEIKTVFKNEDWSKDFSKYNLVFSSPNGLRIFFQEAFSRQLDLHKLKKQKFFCIGKATKKSLEEFGFTSEELPEKASAKELIKILPKEDCLFIGNPEGEVAKNLDASAEVFALYQSFPYEKGLWPEPDANISHIVICSPKSLEAALKILGKKYLQSKKLFAFGPTSANALKKENLDYQENTVSGSWPDMVKTIKEDLER